MKRALTVVVLFFSMLSIVVAAGQPADIGSALPPEATVTKTQEADLNGDGRAEVIVGFTLPSDRLPPMLGQVSVLERMRNGTYRRLDLEAAWPGHYPPEFTVIDVTGDLRPELVVQANGGAAWRWLEVYRRGDGGYDRLLVSHGLDHVLWDADGDGTLDIFGRLRTLTQRDLALQRYRWLNGRFVAWHAVQRSYKDWRGGDGRTPNLLGLTLEEAESRVHDAGMNLGVIAEIDTPGPPNRIFRQSLPRTVDTARQVDVAVAAGDTRFERGSQLPGIDQVIYVPGAEPGTVPAASTAEQRHAWQDWLGSLVQGVEQVVHTRALSTPAYLVRLEKPWSVTVGGKREEYRWVGLGVEPPSEGLLFLAVDGPEPRHTWPPFRFALYTRTPTNRVPVPPAPP